MYLHMISGGNAELNNILMHGGICPVHLKYIIGDLHYTSWDWVYIAILKRPWKITFAPEICQSFDLIITMYL